MAELDPNKESAGSGDHHDSDHDDSHAESHGNHAPHEEGEPWLVSYADLMTLLFGFFVIMYTFAAASPQNEECVRLKLMDAFRSDSPTSGDSVSESAQNAALRALELLVTMLNLESIEEVIQKIQDAEEKARNGEGEGAESRDKNKKLSSDDLKALMGAEEIKDLVTISIPVDVLFDQGAIQLKKTSAQKLQEVSRIIRKVENIDGIRIIGHTDSTTNDIKDGLDSWALSVVRASEVAKFLTRNSIEKRMLTVEGRGSSEPLLPEVSSNGNLIKENMQKNRRIEILVSKDRKYVR